MSLSDLESLAMKKCVSIEIDFWTYDYFSLVDVSTGMEIINPVRGAKIFSLDEVISYLRNVPTVPSCGTATLPRSHLRAN
jgi:hypothetical protein